MEFLRTPEPAAAHLAAANGSTPRTPLTAPNGAASLDRAGIKSSFQQLFTPNHAPQFLPGASGLTPFLGGATPNFVTPGIGMMPMGLTPSTHKASAEIMLSSPYLQAAAKEAVRREFMNMPSYITGNAPVPAPVGSPPQPQVYSTDGRPVTSTPPTPKSTGSQQTTDENNNNRVVPTDSNKIDSTADDTDSESAAKVPQSAGAGAPNGKPLPTNVPPPAAASMPYAGHQPPFFAPPGVFLMPQMVPGHHPHHAQMNGGVFVHPGNGMMMTYAGMPGMGMQGMPMPMNGMNMMMPQMAMPVGTKPIPKHETSEQKKVRVEEEKQQLIREFKKKTREAALVRFRQKRRERRFGKLIRYACRKQLADARPRVKGRFVRINNDDNKSTSPASSSSSGATKTTTRKGKKKATDDAPQVVPNMK